MKDLKRKWFGFISFIPLLAYTVPSVYFFLINRPLIHAHQFGDHFKVNGVTANHFDSLTWQISVATVIAGIIYFYCLIHILRITYMSRWTKMGWLVFLTFSGAFGFPYFWYRQLRREPRDIALNPSIG